MKYAPRSIHTTSPPLRDEKDLNGASVKVNGASRPVSPDTERSADKAPAWVSNTMDYS